MVDARSSGLSESMGLSMPQMPKDLPEDFRARVWEQMYEHLFKDLRMPTDREMREGLAVRRVKASGDVEVLPREILWGPKPRGWVWDRFSGADKKGCNGKKIVWFGSDYAKAYKPARQLSADDLGVHRAIAAMTKPTRANEL